MTTITETQRIVYQMMTENTGVHMMDSSGATGRMWQRNQRLRIEDFIEEPRAWLDYGANISIFHFFTEFLVYDDEMTKEIIEVADQMPKDSWFSVREAFIEQKVAKGWVFYNTYNTYNDPDTIHLSQIFEGSDLEDPDENRLLIVMLHNGADVRGGYTMPYAFRYKGNYMEEFVCGMIDYDLFCKSADCDYAVSVHGMDIFDRDGCLVDGPTWEQIESKTCPKCNTEGVLDIDVNW